MLSIPIIVGTIVAGGIMVAGKATGINEAVDKLSYSIKLRSLKLKKLTTIVIAIDVKLINPTSEKFEIKNTWIKLYRNSSEISITELKQKLYTLEAYGAINLENIEFPIAITSLGQDLFTLATKIDFKKSLSENAKIIESNANAILKGMKVQISSSVNAVPIVFEETLGFAPLSAIERPIKDAKGAFDKYFPEPFGKKELVIKDGSVDDTVKKMIEIVNKDAHLIKDASEKLFKSKSVLEISKKIFDFVYKFIKYNLEEGEQLKNPLVTYHLGQRLAVKNFKKTGAYDKAYSADCDDISIFVASVLKNLKIPYIFRIASYKDYLGNDNGYSHVYVVVPQKDQSIIIDPVYYYFNKQKNFSRKKDFMALSGIDVYYLSGLDGGADALSNVNLADDNALFQFLSASRDKILTQKDSSEVLRNFDYVLKYWNTNNRDRALQIVIDREKKLNGTLANAFFTNLISNLPLWKKARQIKRSSGNEQELLKASENMLMPLNAGGNDGLHILGAEDDTYKNSINKTLKSIFSTYKIPIAIGGGLLAFAATRYFYNRNKNEK